MNTAILDNISMLPGLHFIKDTESNYIAASDDLVNIAGFNAGSTLVGKSDFDAPWETFAEVYRSGDKRAMQTTGSIQTIELFLTPHEVHFIMVTKRAFIQDKKIRGIIGNAQIISKTLQQQLLQLKMDDKNKPHRQYNITNTFPLLTQRESQVLFHLIRKKTAKEIAKLFSISPRTVEKQIERIKYKFNVKSKTELADFALQHNLESILLKSNINI